MRLFGRIGTVGVLLLLSACQNMGSTGHHGVAYDAPHNIAADTANSVAGNFLAARYGQDSGDWLEAAPYMTSVALAAPEDLDLAQRAFFLSLMTGDFERSLEFAHILGEGDDPNYFASLFLLADDIKNGGSVEVNDELKFLSDNGMGLYLSPLFNGWHDFVLGDEEGAIDIFEAESDNQTFGTLYGFHAGLAAELSGDFTRADSLYATVLDKGLSIRGKQIIARYYASRGRFDDALNIIEAMQEIDPDSLYFEPDLAALRNGEVPAAFISNPAEAFAEGLFDFSVALSQENAEQLALIYGHIAEYLNPDFDYLHFMLGSYFVNREQVLEGERHLAAIPAESGLYWPAQLMQIDIFEIQGNYDLALLMAENLKQRRPERADIRELIGDIYRHDENWLDAIDSYNQALSRIEVEQPSDWNIYYKRAIIYDKLDDWDLAEADLLHALELAPNQAYLLNYLGYSWADQGVRLDEAIDMIERAVQMRPQDGYLVDSLGWVFYRIGNYQEAVQILEQAAYLVADDPEITGHLGDAYWRVGRVSEARFQWQRALRYSDETSDLTDSLEEKLLYGLDDIDENIEAHDGGS